MIGRLVCYRLNYISTVKRNSNPLTIKEFYCICFRIPFKLWACMTWGGPLDPRHHLIWTLRKNFQDMSPFIFVLVDCTISTCSSWLKHFHSIRSLRLYWLLLSPSFSCSHPSAVARPHGTAIVVPPLYQLWLTKQLACIYI